MLNSLYIEQVIQVVAKDSPQIDALVNWNNEVIHKRIKSYMLLLICLQKMAHCPLPCVYFPLQCAFAAKCHQEVGSISSFFKSRLNFVTSFGQWNTARGDVLQSEPSSQEACVFLLTLLDFCHTVRTP